MLHRYNYTMYEEVDNDTNRMEKQLTIFMKNQPKLSSKMIKRIQFKTPHVSIYFDDRLDDTELDELRVVSF